MVNAMEGFLGPGTGLALVGSYHMWPGPHSKAVTGGQLRPGAVLYTGRKAEVMVWHSDLPGYLLS